MNENGQTLSESSVQDNLKEEIKIPRGINAPLLITQVENTIPYVFANQELWLEKASYLEPLFKKRNDLSFVEHFNLCLAAHWATVGSFVPTDVDVHIRHKLWHPALRLEEIDEMAALTLSAYDWPFTPLSNRYASSSSEKARHSSEGLTGLKNISNMVAGHQGEWFSVAVAAYAATRKQNPERALQLFEKIQFEMTREAKVYSEARRSRDGIAMLKVATMIAHNLGDFDRVCEAWALPSDDPLMVFGYKAGHEEGDMKRFSGLLVEAGRLNKAFMSPENHRHLSLRAARGLRMSEDFLLPVAPFFDEWGAKVAKHPLLKPSDYADILDSLYVGWEKLKGPDGKTVTYGYVRAVSSILEYFPGGMRALDEILPARVSRNLKSGLFRSLISVSKDRFLEQWNRSALHFVFGKK